MRGKAPPDGDRQWCATSDGVKHGPWREWYANGSIQTEGQFERGKMSGRWVSSFETGARKETGSYSDGLKVGVWTKWYEDGTVARETHFDGSSRSTWTVWRENGIKWAEGETVSAHFDGPYREWHYNGQLAAEGSYRTGQKVGEWRYWTFEGQPTDEPVGDLDEMPE